MSDTMKRWDGTSWVPVLSVNRIVIETGGGGVEFTKFESVTGSSSFYLMNNSINFDLFSNIGTGSMNYIPINNNINFNNFTEVI